MSKIGVDIDEILSETVRTFLDFYNNKHSTSFVFDVITDYHFGKLIGISLDEEKRAVGEFYSSEVARDLPTLPGSVKAIKKLAQENELYAVSSRPTQLMPLTTEWINSHYPNCFTDIILTNSHFDATKTKSDVCKNLELDIFIDDQIVYAEDCAIVCEKVFLMNKPWSKGTLVAPNIIRVDSWADITQAILCS